MRIGPRIGPLVGSQIGQRVAPAGAPSFVGNSGIVFDEPSDTTLVIASTPDDLRPGDSLLIIIVSTTSDGAPPSATLPVGWSIIASASTGSGAVVTVIRRVSGSESGDDYTVPLVDGSGILAVGAAIVAYRGLDTSVAGTMSAVDVTASTSFPCPSRTLAHAADLYLGIAWVTDAAPAVTPPAGATERFFGAQLGDFVNPRQIEVFEIFPGATGATGTKTATTAAPHSGIAASIALKAA